MKCVNCDQQAVYVYEISANQALVYCDSDLPRFLHAHRDGGTLKLVPEWEALQAPAPVEEPVVEEPVVEEAPVEEEPVVAPTTKPKTTKTQS